MEELDNRCLLSVSFLVIINGKPRGKFKRTSGLREGDPLSLFLFAIVADGLGRLVGNARVYAIFKGFLIGRDDVEVPHL